MTDPVIVVIEELKTALDEAATTIEVGPVLGQGLLRKRVERYRFLANAQAPLVTEKPHRMAAIQKYIDQLESLARAVIGDGGQRADEARLIMSGENLRVIGLADDRPSTGKFHRVSMNTPTLDEPCTHPERNGKHEVYWDGRREYCRACGAEKTRK